MNLKEAAISGVYSLFRLLPVEKNKVLVFSYYGEQYSGSPKYIAEYLSGKEDVRVVWAFVRPEKHLGVKGETVRYGHGAYYYHLATAGTIITNYRMTGEFQKRKSQKYIQTWHSSLRLKRIEKDAEETLPAGYVEMAKRDSLQLDYLLAGSRRSREIFERAFWYKGSIVNSGTPQCDILFGDQSAFRNKVFQHYQIPEGSHVALYAPTFRKGHDTSAYDLDTDQLQKALEKRFGGRWYVLMRLHPHLAGLTGCFRYTETVLQATDYDDVQELLCAADVLISDYSAIMFDYSVTRRPCFLYTPDFEAYTTKDRQLYFDIKELPFPAFEQQEEMFRAIESFSEESYRKAAERFMEQIGSYDDGHASERVYQLIKGEEA